MKARAPTLAVGGLLLLLASWQLLGRATSHAIGRGDSACPDHLWGLWVTAQGLPNHGPWLRDTDLVGWPDGFRALQYEAPNLLGFLPGFWLGGGGIEGAVLGWNTLHLLALVLAVFGCWRLGRLLFGPRPELSILAAGFVGSSFFAMHPSMGHTEYLPVSAYPLHLALLGSYLQRGGWWRGMLAAVLLGGMAATASYLAVFLAVTEPPLALALATRATSWRVAVRRLATVSVPAVAMVVMFAWAMSLPWPTGHGAFAGQSVAGGRPPLSGADLLHGLTRLWPGKLDMRSNEVPGYPGVFLGGLALLGGLRRPRQALPWLGTGVLCWVLSAGVATRWGQAMVVLPAGWLTSALPALRSVHWWERLGCLTPLPLAVSAVWGLDGLGGIQRTVAAWALPLLMLLDTGTFPGVRTWTWPAFDLRISHELLVATEALPEGAILPLPLPLVHLPGKAVATGPYLLWQPQHGRAITTIQTLAGDRLLGRSYLVGLVANRQATRGRESVPGGDGTVDAHERSCARTDAAFLAGDGLAGVVLHTRLSRGRQLEPLLTEILGTPATEGSVRIWDITAVHAHGAPCTPPPTARALRAVVPPAPPQDAPDLGGR